MEFVLGAFLLLVGLALVEALGRILFWPAAYRFGPRILKERLRLSADGPDLSDAETKNGRLRRRGDLVLLRTRWRPLEWQSAILLTGTLRVEGDECLVEARVPVAAAAFTVGFVGLWVWAFVTASPPSRLTSSLLPAAFGCAVLGAIVWVSLLSERQRVIRVVREYLGARLTGASS